MTKVYDVKAGSIQDIADAMRRDFKPKASTRAIGKTVLFIGAGCSKSANIPLASEIAQTLVCKLALNYGLLDRLVDNPLIALTALVENGRIESRDAFHTFNGVT